MAKLVVMIDGGFLMKAGATTLRKHCDQLRIDPGLIVTWSRISANRMDQQFMRLYWYDAIHEQGHRSYVKQRATMDELSQHEGIQVRLGNLVQRSNAWESKLKGAMRLMGWDIQALRQHFDFPKHYEQKGVDTLLVLDMVKLAQLNAYDTLILVSGDTDLAEAVRTVQEYGKRVIIARPEKAGKAPTLFDLADESVVLTAETLKFMLPTVEPTE